MDDSKPSTPSAPTPETPPSQQGGTLQAPFDLKEWHKAVTQEMMDNLSHHLRQEDAARKHKR